MYRGIYFVLFIMVFLSSQILGAETELSNENDQWAKEELRFLHFAEDGRGMILAPGLLEVLETFVPGASQTTESAEFLQQNFFSVWNGESQVPGFVEKGFAKRWGLFFDEDGLVGFNGTEHKGITYGAMGCVVCHSGKAAGQHIIGLGNKNIDISKMASEVFKMEKLWWNWNRFRSRSSDFREIEENAMVFSEYLSNEDMGNLTQGLVPTAFIKGWFYRVQGLPLPKTAKGQVKVPQLWGYEKKRLAGQFCDGFGDGTEVGWGIAVELAAGQTPETARSYYDKIKDAEEVFNYFLPPKYPFEIDNSRAREGQKIFSKTCSGCHGTYEKSPAGFPIYKQPKRIPWQVVKTDFDRLAVGTPEFFELINTSPLNDIMKYKYTSPGYFAPRLDGIWSRFPYLHNASIPNLYQLLLPEDQRVKFFSLQDSGEKYRFDQQKIGLSLPSLDELKRFENRKGLSRSIYDTRRVGHSNRGHNFTSKMTDEDRYSLIEYLKTL
jgi:mono/diheme cytochrome c family protein